MSEKFSLVANDDASHLKILNAEIPSRLHGGVHAAILVLVASAPASTKLAGAAWLLVVLVGLWAALRPPIAWPSSHPLVKLSRIWLVVCLASIALQAAATLYWEDSWGDLHVLIRLLLSAVAALAIARRLRLRLQQKTALTHALAAACFIALGVVYLYGRSTPSGAVSWAAGVSFLVCLMVPIALKSAAKIWQRLVWSLAVVAGLAAVIFSQSRGSYGLVLWVAVLTGIVGLEHLRKRLTLKKKFHLFDAIPVAISAAVATLLTVLFLTFPQLHEIPNKRIQEASNEVRNIVSPDVNTVRAIDTSVGARLHIWQAALGKITESPFLGYGRKARIEWLHQLGDADNSNTIKSLDHLHNDPLNIMFDHGMLGLTSYCLLGLGLAWIAIRSQGENTIFGLRITGILWMHLTTGLTNSNFSHNYYGVMLALSLSLTLMLSTKEAD